MSELARQLIAECQRTKATYLDLGNCGLTDLNEIPELFECTQLETLVLSNEWWDYEKGEWEKSQNQGKYNKVSILSSGFLGLKNLNSLICGGQLFINWQIADIFILKDLRNLAILDLSRNKITDISFLKDLENLTSLSLSSNQITDYSFLKDLGNLTTLYLSSSQITDYSFLKDLENLTSLSLSSNQITDYSFLKDLENLTVLDLSENLINDISYLKDLNSLIQLNLKDNQITDISYLKGLLNLNQLDLRGNQITDISYLKDLRNLIKLKLSYNYIIDISCLKDLERVRKFEKLRVGSIFVVTKHQRYDKTVYRTDRLPMGCNIGIFRFKTQTYYQITSSSECTIVYGTYGMSMA